MLAAARRVGRGDRLVRAGEWTGWAPGQLLGQPIAGRTLGIVGMGAIGQGVARRARGFSMAVLYNNRSRLPETVEADVGARFVSLEELLDESDVVSLHAPLNEESRHLIDAAALARMKSTAVLVNTGRGPLIDEAALVTALPRRADRRRRPRRVRGRAAAGSGPGRPRPGRARPPPRVGHHGGSRCHGGAVPGQHRGRAERAGGPHTGAGAPARWTVNGTSARATSRVLGGRQAGLARAICTTLMARSSKAASQ